LHNGQRKIWLRPLEAIQIAWNGSLTSIEVRLPEIDFRGKAGFLLQLEDGDIQAGSLKLDSGKIKERSTIDGRNYQCRTIPCQFELGTGYHQFTLETRSGHSTTTILSAPTRMFSPPKSARAWGLFAPLYGLRNRAQLGSGTFSHLERLLEWQASRGGQFVGTLPLLPAFLDEPFEVSPYSPVTRLAWNEFYIDLERIADLENCPAAQKRLRSSSFQKRLRALDGEEVVGYKEEMALKRSVLEILADFHFQRKGPRRALMDEFLATRPHLVDYAAFRATVEKQGSTWGNWPERMRRGTLRVGDYAEDVKRYYLYAQWIAHEQMEHVATTGRRLGVSLYLDMPLGVNSDGFDAWRNQDLFALGASGGAPPDAVFTKGQDWGFAPLHPQRARETGYEYMVAYLRHHLRHAGILRIDHVMGIHRLYWVPKGLPASQGAYVRYPFSELYAVLSIESHRHQSIIVGENLGTVPPAVNASMDTHRVGEMFVVQYELRPDPKEPLRLVPPRSVASLNTHDMPPFAAFWVDSDIADRQQLGLINPEGVAAEKEVRARMRSALVTWLRRHANLGKNDQSLRSVLQACLRGLARSPGEYLLINLEDLWLETASQNVPGTTGERVNWRRRLRYDLAELESFSEVMSCLAEVEQARRSKQPAKG
jgi:4-alpha-glucanotransferase